MHTVGSVKNAGVEGTLTATLLDARNIGWDVTIGASHNSNKVVTLGLDPGSTLAEAHARASEIEQRVLVLCPAISELTVHTEP